MKICLVSQEYPPETAHGGIGSQTYLKAHGLAGLGHHVHVVSRSVDKERHDYADGSVRITRIPGSEARLPAYTEIVDWLTYSTEVAVALAGLHRQHQFDLIDFPEWAGEGYVHLLNRSEWNYVPAVVQIHGPLSMFAKTLGWPEIGSDFLRVGAAMEGTCLRLADRVYSSSACSADWCAREYGLNRESIPVIHTGVDTTLFAPPTRRDGARKRLIFVGRVTGDKGVPMLVDAACVLANGHPGLEVEICGRGDAAFIAGLEKKAKLAGHPNLLKFRGFVARTDLPAHLQNSTLFVGPSTHEPGPGIVYLEAMACGLPVVACSGAGAAEVVVPEENGLLVSPGDSAGLAVALNRLLCDPCGCHEMGDRARRYAMEHADSVACLSNLEAFYTKLAGACHATESL